MGDRIPGPTCASKVGPDWIDKGTLCRTRSSAPRPLGMLMSMVMGATPPREQEPADRALEEWRANHEREKKQEQEDLKRDTPNHINKCIENLKGLPIGAWRSQQERELILKKLKELNKANMIEWVAQDDRGGHEKGKITINLDLHSGDWEKDAWMKSAPVLVHEATHAVWSNSYFNPWRMKWNRDHQESCKDHPKGEALIAEETYAWDNELKVYEVLNGKGLSDMLLEERLNRKRKGSTETMVREAYSGWINMDGFK